MFLSLSQETKAYCLYNIYLIYTINVEKINKITKFFTNHIKLMYTCSNIEHKHL